MYLDQSVLKELSLSKLQDTKPFPVHLYPRVLSETGNQKLMEELPRAELFRWYEGDRHYGQRGHPCHKLTFEAPFLSKASHRPGYCTDILQLPRAWQEFICEFRTPFYQNFIEKMFQKKNLVLRFVWQKVYGGDDVSPHTDAAWRAGAQFFYFNPVWDSTWGGEFVLLSQQKNTRLNPEIDDFQFQQDIPVGHCQSILLPNSKRSWHAVRKVNPKAKTFRLVFIVLAGHPVHLRINRIFDGVKNRLRLGAN